MMMNNNKRLSNISIATAIACILGTQHVYAGNFFEDVGRAATEVVTAPAKVLEQTVRSGSQIADDVFHGNVPQAVQDSGRAIQDSGRVVPNIVRDMGDRSNIPAVEQATSAYAAVATINSDLLGTATIVGGNVLAGQDPRQVYAAPLAAAIHNARNAHYRGSQPIPQAIHEALRGTIPDAVLDNARYTIGHLELTVSNIINQFNRAFGDQYAVTVDDVIVFSVSLSGNPNNQNELHWWAHELTHVAQYQEWGVEQFALNYIDNYSAVEKEADNSADVALSRYADNHGYSDSAPSQYADNSGQTEFGDFCETAIGRFGPGTQLPIGSACNVNGPYGFVSGFITR